ncbi:hypothetical protein DEO72_LG11g2295 [Vigna unguiculata]|uniref:Uncharacterized protein n=1 Tax=Vigna unguiculata TaxID=3917 RepID=A0A4D6NNU1_VIGUN|nr:hypothetical protein DEO72_LG11g2295 [Vigna unguiculata]
MEGCHVIIFISQNRNPNFPQTLAATINLHGSRRHFRPPRFCSTIFSPPWTNLDGSRFTHQQPRQPPSARRSSVTTAPPVTVAFHRTCSSLESTFRFTATVSSPFAHL